MIVPRELKMKFTQKKKKLTVSSAAPLMPRSWLKLEPAAAGDLFGASGLTA